MVAGLLIMAVGVLPIAFDLFRALTAENVRSAPIRPRLYLASIAVMMVGMGFIYTNAPREFPV